MSEENSKENKPIFDANAGENEPRLRPFTEKTRQELFAKDLPLTYQDGRCPTEDYFIQEYKDGRIHLVHFAIYSRKFTLVKVLTNGGDSVA